MAKSISVDQNKKRRPGRPATGRDPALSARVPKEVLARLDQWAAATGRTRSEAVAALLDLGLAAANSSALAVSPAKPTRPSKPLKATKSAPTKKTRPRRS
jgi:predicted DNA-binding protein